MKQTLTLTTKRCNRVSFQIAVILPVAKVRCKTEAVLHFGSCVQVYGQTSANIVVNKLELRQLHVTANMHRATYEVGTQSVHLAHWIMHGPCDRVQSLPASSYSSTIAIGSRASQGSLSFEHSWEMLVKHPKSAETDGPSFAETQCLSNTIQPLML